MAFLFLCIHLNIYTLYILKLSVGCVSHWRSTDKYSRHCLCPHGTFSLGKVSVNSSLKDLGHKPQTLKTVQSIGPRIYNCSWG